MYAKKPAAPAPAATPAAPAPISVTLSLPEPAAKPAPTASELLKSKYPISDHSVATANFAKGGHVKGKGTGTSDSIPARLSKGEYVLPADTVKAVGVKKLDQLRAETHQYGNKHEKTLPRKAMHTRGKNRGM
jgi:hypothetical protein